MKKYLHSSIVFWTQTFQFNEILYLRLLLASLPKLKKKIANILKKYLKKSL